MKMKIECWDKNKKQDMKDYSGNAARIVFRYRNVHFFSDSHRFHEFCVRN